MRKILRICFKKKTVNIEEDEKKSLLENDNTIKSEIFQVNKSNTYQIEKQLNINNRIFNMTQRWNISTKDALELIHNVESRQS